MGRIKKTPFPANLSLVPTKGTIKEGSFIIDQGFPIENPENPHHQITVYSVIFSEDLQYVPCWPKPDRHKYSHRFLGNSFTNWIKEKPPKSTGFKRLGFSVIVLTLFTSRMQPRESLTNVILGSKGKKSPVYQDCLYDFTGATKDGKQKKPESWDNQIPLWKRMNKSRKPSSKLVLSKHRLHGRKKCIIILVFFFFSLVPPKATLWFFFWGVWSHDLTCSYQSRVLLSGDIYLKCHLKIFLHGA